MEDALAGLIGLIFGGRGLLITAFAGMISVGGMVLWIVMLVEVLQKETDENNTKMLWTLVIILAGWIGALIYVLARRRERIATLGR